MFIHLLMSYDNGNTCSLHETAKSIHLPNQVVKICVSFKNITKLMSCGVVSGLSLNLSNITQINADVVVGGIKAIWNINLSFRCCLFGFFTMRLCKISLFQNKSCLINVNS